MSCDCKCMLCLLLCQLILLLPFQKTIPSSDVDEHKEENEEEEVIDSDEEESKEVMFVCVVVVCAARCCVSTRCAQCTLRACVLSGAE